MTSGAPALGGPLGAFRVDHVLDWYDEPIVYTAVNALGVQLLGMAVRDGGVLFVPVSADRVAAVRTGILSLRDAYARPEIDGVAYLMDREGQTEVLSSVPAAMLPKRDFYYQESIDTAAAFTPERLATISERQGRTLVALQLKPPGMGRTEMPADDHAAIVHETQVLVKVAQITDDDDREGEDEEDRELGVVGAMAASYVILLAPLQRGRLFSGASPAIRHIRELLRATQLDMAQFGEVADRYSVRTRVHLRDFLIALNNADTGVSLYEASGGLLEEPVTIDLDNVRDGIAALRNRVDLPSKEHKFSARLVGIDHVRMKFKVETAKPPPGRRNPRPYGGHIEPHLRSKIDGITSGKSTLYTVTLIEDRTRTEYGAGNIRRRYRLTDLEPITDP